MVRTRFGAVATDCHQVGARTSGDIEHRHADCLVCPDGREAQVCPLGRMGRNGTTRTDAWWPPAKEEDWSIWRAGPMVSDAGTGGGMRVRAGGSGTAAIEVAGRAPVQLEHAPVFGMDDRGGRGQVRLWPHFEPAGRQIGLSRTGAALRARVDQRQTTIAGADMRGECRGSRDRRYTPPPSTRTGLRSTSDVGHSPSLSSEVDCTVPGVRRYPRGVERCARPANGPVRGPVGGVRGVTRSPWRSAPASPRRGDRVGAAARSCSEPRGWTAVGTARRSPTTPSIARVRFW